MSLNLKDTSQFASIARRVVELIDATTIAITDVNPSGTNLTRNQIAALVNRYYSETPGVGSPAALAEDV